MRAPVVIRLTMIRPDGRGWVGLGCYALVAGILWMIWQDRTLLRDDFFKVIATAIVLTGWNGGPVGWAYQATKNGGELADRNAGLVAQQINAPPPGMAGGEAERPPQ